MNDSTGTGTLETPHKHTPAQLLLQMSPPRRTGFLRKRGKRERMLENLKFAKTLLARLLRWRQRFVVVSQGCIYVFSSETATTPVSSFSLRGYNRLVVMESEQSPWTFRVVSPDETVKIHYFACFSDEDRKQWMTAIREEMLLANNVEEDRASAGSVGSDVYVYLQRPVFTPPESPQHGDDSEDSDDSDYDKIDDIALERTRPCIPLPPIPTDEYKEVDKTDKRPDATKNKTKGNAKTEHDYVNKPKAKPPAAQPEKPKPKPKLKAKPQAVTRKPSEVDYYFPDNNRDKALSVLRSEKEMGTYLVRDSRVGDNKVLAVLTEDDVKEYKILSKDKKVTINNRDYYKSVEDLVEAYQTKPLPNRTTTLTRAYSSQNLHV